MKKITPYLLAITLLGFLFACDEKTLDTGNEQNSGIQNGPIVETLEADSSDLFIVTAYGKVSGLEAVATDFECGIEYSKDIAFSKDSTWRVKANVNYSEKEYKVNLTNIEYGCKYYYRAYCINRQLIYYGKIKEFSFSGSSISGNSMLLIGNWHASNGNYYSFYNDSTGLSYDSYGHSLSFEWKYIGVELELKFRGSGENGKNAYTVFIIRSISNEEIIMYDKYDSNKENIVLQHIEESDLPWSISFNDVNKGVSVINGKDGKVYRVVNLGLPSGNLWAVCNIDASSPEETGSFFAWGETAPKNSFTWGNYKWGERLELTKYCFDEEKGDIDSKSVLEMSDDAANYIMGEGWQTPSANDFNELLSSRNCDKRWCKLNGVGGFLFTSVKNGYEGNSLFIPLSGMQDFDVIRFNDRYGFYWSNELYYDNINRKYMSNEASVLWLEHLDNVDNQLVDFRTRYLGLPIRPVYVPE